MTTNRLMMPNITARVGIYEVGVDTDGDFSPL